jgi:uncharacterized protein (TIGR03437 family)
VQVGLVNNFTQAAGIATPLSIHLLDNCGNAITKGQVIARFSNGDTPLELKLVETSSGLYSGTWTPGAISPQVSITSTANASGYPAAASQITGMVTTSGVPYITPGGAVHIYNSLLGGAVAPGTILAIYGSNFAGAAATDSGAPLPATLGTTSVTVGGIPAPLYYVSPNQIDAQMPLELTPNKEYEVIIANGGARSTPGSLQVIAAAPGIAALANGQVIAQHADYSLVTDASPAKPGEFLVIYLAGMGATDIPLANGAASPSSPLAQPTIAPVLTLNGSSIPIYFAGLTPGFVGLYQMNFQVPADTASGKVQLVVSQSGVASNLTVLPVQR